LYEKLKKGEKRQLEKNGNSGGSPLLHNFYSMFWPYGPRNGTGP
jgi:hypothetical protein